MHAISLILSCIVWIFNFCVRVYKRVNGVESKQGWTDLTGSSWRNTRVDKKMIDYWVRWVFVCCYSVQNSDQYSEPLFDEYEPIYSSFKTSFIRALIQWNYHLTDTGCNQVLWQTATKKHFPTKITIISFIHRHPYITQSKLNINSN